MRIVVTLILLFSIAGSGLASWWVRAQDDLPTYGKIDDLARFQKVYLAAESTDARERMKDELGKVLELEYVDDPKAANFVLEYKVLSRTERQSILGGSILVEKGELRAWFKRDDGSKVVAWSETETWDGGRAKKPDRKLAEKFAKALRKVRGT